MEPEQFAGMKETTEVELRGRLCQLELQNKALRRDLTEVDRLVCDDCKLQQLLLEEYALQHAHEAVYLIDANHRFVYANEEACRALGYSREALLGMTVQDIDAHYSSAELVAVQAQGRAEGTVRHETRHRRRDGSSFPVEIQSSSFEYRGQYMGIALARDISERKHSEMRLEAAKKLLRQRNAELLAYKETLEQRVAEKTAKLLAEIAERERAERELEASHLQLRREIARREATREEERRRIAREVHDELGQILTGLMLHVSHLDRVCALEGNPLCGEVREISELTDQAMGVARNIAVVLRPVEAEMDIVSALKLQANRFSTLTGIRCECSFPDDALMLNERCTTAFYRIVQELLTNVSRHANADRVQISLARVGPDYVAQVRDNGTGFEPGAIKQDSFGLAGIRERVSTLSGTMDIDSQAGRGVEVTVRIPVEVCHD